MACKDTAGRARRRCLDWELNQRRACASWRVEWIRRCEEWRTTWEQRCTASHTEQERRCDRWEQEQTRSCANWIIIFRWLCLAWTWVTTLVCRVWSWFTRIVCDIWTWVSSTICLLWTFIGILLCDLWVLITTFICRSWVLVIDFWCLFFCMLRRWLAPNEYSQSRSECIYGWTSAYRVAEDPGKCLFTIVLRIRLVADAGVTAADMTTVRNRWEPAIEAAWSGQYSLVLEDGSCTCEQYTVQVIVQFVDSNEHHTVTVHPGAGRADMANWYVNSTGGTAAHEAGHMFGNADEYNDANCPDRVVTADGSIMQTSQRGTVKERHYEGFARWLSNRTCCTYRV